MKRLLLILFLFGLPENGWAEDVYLPPDDFISRSFHGLPPEPSMLWLKADTQEEIRKVLGRRYPAMRLRYWKKEGRTAWILEEIGKVKPITTGYLIGPGGIEWMQVLIYRETHGWEVKYPAFTDQFKEASLTGEQHLDRDIDGIAGATLSVNALTRLAQLALYLHGKVMADDR